MQDKWLYIIIFWFISLGMTNLYSYNRAMFKQKAMDDAIYQQQLNIALLAQKQALMQNMKINANIDDSLAKKAVARTQIEYKYRTKYIVQYIKESPTENVVIPNNWPRLYNQNISELSKNG